MNPPGLPPAQRKKAAALRKRIERLKNEFQTIVGSNLTSILKAISRRAKHAKPPKWSKGSVSDKLARLTEREAQVLKLTAQEYTAREIAKKLKIGTRTVETYRASLILKIGVRSIAGLTRFAIAAKIISAE